jgi:hypothetical protein
MRIQKVAVGCLIWLFTCTSPASADVILFDNLPSVISPFTSYIFGNNGPDEGLSWRAMQFIAEDTATLRTVTAPLAWETFTTGDGGGTGALRLVLYASAGGLPGEVLEEFIRPGSSPTMSFQTFESIARPRLVAGVEYFLAAQSLGFVSGEWGALEEELRWVSPSQGGPSYDALSRWFPGTALRPAALRLTGDPEVLVTPEPASGLLLLGGLAAVLRARSKRRHQ